MKTIERTAAAILVIAAGLALGFAFPAAANEVPPKPQPAPQPAPQAQKQEQGQAQLQGQAQTQAQQSEAEATAAAAALARAQAGSTAAANSDASNGGQSLTYIQRDRLQAPNVYAPTVAPSSVCGTGWSVGVSGPGAAVAGGRSKVDPACEAREEARLELERERYAMSYLVHLNPALALRVLCQESAIARAVKTPQDCEFVVPVAAPEPAPAAAGSSTLTEERVREMIDRAFRASQAK